MTNLAKSSSTSYKDTAFGIIPRAKLVLLEAEGIKRALQFILTLGKEKQNITPKLICEIHGVGFGWIFPDWAGKFRTIQVKVGAYFPPHYSQIPELVKNLCDDLQERLHYIPLPKLQNQFLKESISLLAWFQHRFVWIHPFQDYNGRVGRLLTNLILLRLNLPLMEIKADTGSDRKRYIEAMKAADSHDLTKLEELIAKALSESLNSV